MTGLALPQVPLHWVASTAGTRPVLTSTGAETISIRGGQSGSTFDDLEIDNTSANGIAFDVESHWDAIVRRAVIKGPRCLSAASGDAVVGEVTVEDSVLSGPVGRTCAFMGIGSVLRRSTVSQTAGIATETPPAAVVSQSLVEDVKVQGGLQLLGTGAVARRVDATGWTGIWGEGLIVDSVARAIGSNGAAIAAAAPHGGTLRVVNATAVAASAPALEALPSVSPGFVDFDILQVSNSIARGTPDLRVVPPPVPCPTGSFCDIGLIRIDHSNFVTREPAVGAPGDTIEVRSANQSGDPRFVNASAGDLHLRAGSSAIDAGDDPQGRSLPADADGHPRVQGAAIDLGAYEFSPPAATAQGAASAAGPGPGPGAGAAATGARAPRDVIAPRLGRLKLSHARFRAAVGTTLTAATSLPGELRVVVQRRAGNRWKAVGATLERRVPRAGVVKLILTRSTLRRLSPGRYRFVVTALDSAGHRSPSRTISFTVLAAGGA